MRDNLQSESRFVSMGSATPRPARRGVKYILRFIYEDTLWRTLAFSRERESYLPRLRSLYHTTL